MSTFSNRQTHTMRSEQGLRSEEGGLQHVCRLYDQHVLQPAQVLKLQSLIRLKTEVGEMLGRHRENEKEEKRGEMKESDGEKGKGKVRARNVKRKRRKLFNKNK